MTIPQDPFKTSGFLLISNVQSSQAHCHRCWQWLSGGTHPSSWPYNAVLLTLGSLRSPGGQMSRAWEFPLSHHYYSILFSVFLCPFLRAKFCFASLNPWWLVWYSVYSRCSINAFECMDIQMVITTLPKRLRAWNYSFKAIAIIMGFILAWASK